MRSNRKLKFKQVNDRGLNLKKVWMRTNDNVQLWGQVEQGSSLPNGCIVDSVYIMGWYSNFTDWAFFLHLNHIMINMDLWNYFQCTPCREGVGWMAKIMKRFGKESQIQLGLYVCVS